MSVQLIVIGASLGGLEALRMILGALPADFMVPIVVAQHRHSDSTDRLAAILQRATALKVVEAYDKLVLEAGHVYLAPPDYHLLVEPGSLALSTDGPVSYARPSIDVLFKSAADVYGAALIAVVLTGANHDGAHGLAMLVAAGGQAIVQAPDSAASAMMPAAALAATAVDFVGPLDLIGPRLIALVAGC